MAVFFRSIEPGRPVLFFIRFNISADNKLTPIVHCAIFG